MMYFLSSLSESSLKYLVYHPIVRDEVQCLRGQFKFTRAPVLKLKKLFNQTLWYNQDFTNYVFQQNIVLFIHKIKIKLFISVV